MVMTLALLVYSVAQRRMRQQLACKTTRFPINPPTDAATDLAVALPTLRGDSPRPGPGARSDSRRH